jgi:TolA-binding protein
MDPSLPPRAPPVTLSSSVISAYPVQLHHSVHIENLVQGIELKEQQLIQQIRTSGIRKPRETSLIDEVLDIRKERRKLFSLLTNAIESSSARITELESQGNRHQSELRSRETLLEQRMENQKKELIRVEELHQQQLAVMAEKYAQTLKDEKRRIAHKYEEKMQLVESKLNELQSSKDNNEAVKAKAEAAIITDIELQCNARVDK